jgi:streptogramin lyase
MPTTFSQEQQITQILQQVKKVLQEPLPKNGSPHVVVIVYDRSKWFVDKAAPKGAGGTG